MNIAILGAGAMGSLFGGFLAEDGAPVVLIDIDAAHLDAIRRDGLRLETAAGDRRVRTLTVCRPEEARAQPDLLIVFTKNLHTRAALTGVRAMIGAHTQVLTLQNGLGNVEVLAEFVPSERILIGVTTWPADMAGPGHVRSHGRGAIRMMSADGSMRPELVAVAQAFLSAGLQCEVDPGVWIAVWEKVAFNAALNSLCATSGCTVDQLGAVDDGPLLAFAVASEVIAVARASGVAVDVERCKAQISHAIGTHIGHQPSMLQDVLAGRPTEIDSINGAVVGKADALGVPVPHTRTLLGLVRLKQRHPAASK